jgi:hypothetical protein
VGWVGGGGGAVNFEQSLLAINDCKSKSDACKLTNGKT